MALRDAALCKAESDLSRGLDWFSKPVVDGSTSAISKIYSGSISVASKSHAILEWQILVPKVWELFEAGDMSFVLVALKKSSLVDISGSTLHGLESGRASQWSL